jgi:diaminohydroxyphosphoribosylaminopyrimidine deaminase/5-amino-6-(5-phosphoribosylamino)uracil reductase
MRAESDAIMVGSATAVADDPELVARRNGRIVHRPVRVLVDSQLRVPPDSRIFQGEADGTWVLCSSQASPRKRRALAASGARLLDVRMRGRHLDLGRAFTLLARSGLTEVLVEGGGRLAAALLSRGLVDEVHWFVAPKLLGEDGRPALGALQTAVLADAITLENVVVRRTGNDVHVQGEVPRCRTSGRRTKQ